jgi:D-galactarolactone cycloisomerase
MPITIDSIDIHHYRFPLDPPFHAAWDPAPRRSLTATLVRVRAGDFEGVGSGDTMLGFAGHEHLFLGQDPFAIERHVRVLDTLQFHYGRCWPLEIALWDIIGQATGQPLWKLLGGLRDTVPLYASTGECKTPDERAASAITLRDMGFPAMKIRFHASDLRDDLAIVRAVRDAVGSDLHILVDANQAWQFPWDTAPLWDHKTARWVANALAELDVFWLEEPLPRFDIAGLADLRRSTPVRIAGGEGAREMAELRLYLQHGAFDVYQPDVAWSTGIHNGCQFGREVQAAGAIYSPHTWGDGLVLLANLHVAAAISNAPWIEYPFDPPTWTPERRDFLLPEPLRPNATWDGKAAIQLSDAPGLGVQIDWPTLEPYRVHTGILEG